MNSRLQQFLAAENISQTQFADSIGVARASVSHIISGRNKPGFEFLESTLRRFPALNIDWLITGRGKMYKIQGTEMAAPLLFDAVSDESNESKESNDDLQIVNNERTITKVVVFYSDNTFEEIK